MLNDSICQRRDYYGPYCRESVTNQSGLELPVADYHSDTALQRTVIYLANPVPGLCTTVKSIPAPGVQCSSRVPWNVYQRQFNALYPCKSSAQKIRGHLYDSSLCTVMYLITERWFKRAIKRILIEPHLVDHCSVIVKSQCKILRAFKTENLPAHMSIWFLCTSADFQRYPYLQVRNSSSIFLDKARPATVII